MVESIQQKDVSQVQLLFPTTALDSEISRMLAGSVSSFPFDHPPAADAGKITVEKMFHMPMPSGVEGLTLPDKPDMHTVGVLAVNLKHLMEYFKGFKIEQIELWISGAAETSGFLNLAIAAKGEGGVKVVLKPSE